jgi:hypothetical protein
MAEETDRTAIIDETPISPVREPSHIRQNSLEKHLQHRPDPKELRDRHILLDTNAAPYVLSHSIFHSRIRFVGVREEEGREGGKE